MAKYRGKYKKCRSCVHAVEPLMELVIVLETCPKLFKSSSGTSFSDKHICEECEFYKEVAADGKADTTSTERERRAN